MDYTYRERHGEAIYRVKNGMLPSDFCRRNVVLSFQEDAIGIRLRPSLIMLAGHVLCGQVRSGLSPGGRWIRTFGPFRKGPAVSASHHAEFVDDHPFRISDWVNSIRSQGTT